MLNGVAEHKGCHAGHRFEFADGFAQVLFFEVVDVEIVKLFKDRLQIVLETLCRFGGIRKIGKHLGEFGHRRHSDFVPIEKILLAFRQSLVGEIVWTILQQTRVE